MFSCVGEILCTLHRFKEVGISLGEQYGTKLQLSIRHLFRPHRRPMLRQYATDETSLAPTSNEKQTGYSGEPSSAAAVFSLTRSMGNSGKPSAATVLYLL